MLSNIDSFSLQEQLLLEPMFEVPGSDITQVLVEEDTARGYHPARYQYKDSTGDDCGEEEGKAEEESEGVPDHHSTTDTSSEIKTSVL